MMRWLWIALISVLFASCGYRVSEDEPLATFPTLSIPYFSGDKDGALTEAVIQALIASNVACYVGQGGALILEGRVIADVCEHLGYQYDRVPTTGKRQNRLIPNEGRRSITVQLTLIDSPTQKIVHGPFTISASSDYDFVDSDSLQDTSFIARGGERISALSFSLGQLDSMNGAQESSLAPIHRCLAHKIVEGIANLAYLPIKNEE